MTDSLYFDNDCMSAFLWVNAEHLLVQMYPGRIIIPQQVYSEITFVPHLQARLDLKINVGEMLVQSIVAGSPDYSLYNKLISKPEAGHSVIGGGEAAAIVLAASSNGIVASNNLRDVVAYVKELSLKHTTTADILVDAYNHSIITESEGNSLWRGMLAKRRRLGGTSFSEYLKCST